MASGKNESAVAVKREFCRKVNVSERAACKCGPIFSPEFYKSSKNATWQKQVKVTIPRPVITPQAKVRVQRQIEIDATSSVRAGLPEIEMSESTIYRI